MTKQVKRYTQPVVQTQPGPEFKIAEVPLFEDPKGKWVKWEDYASLKNAYEQARAAHEPTELDRALDATRPDAKAVDAALASLGLAREPTEQPAPCGHCGKLLGKNNAILCDECYKQGMSALRAERAERYEVRVGKDFWENLKR